MNPLYQQSLDKFRSRRQEFVKKINQIKNKKNFRLDEKMHGLHYEAFERIDCLQCANCCRTLGPRLKDRDIRRLARYLSLKPSEFTDHYLRIDEDGDFVFKSMPCPFLGDDNYCLVYEVRPEACAAYPHTHQTGQQKILSLTLKNAATCPAVVFMLDRLEL
ncbi:MAG: YkgJ family cysteine cluster protein [Bacteroidales bacterium]